MMTFLREKGVHEKSKLSVLLSPKKSVIELERPGFGFLFGSVLASIRTISETVALEVVGSTLRVDTVRGESKTWFTSV